MKYNERNKIYSSCSLWSKQIIAIKIILFMYYEIPNYVGRKIDTLKDCQK